MKRFIQLALSALAMISANSAFACDPGGELPQDLTFTDLTERERDAFETLFAPEIVVMQSEGVTTNDAFAFSRCDLPDTGTFAVFAFARPGLFCESSCFAWGMNQTDDEDWQIILAAEGRIAVAESTSMGWPDLIARVDGFPDIVHKFDGASYRDNLEGLIYGEIFDLPEANGWQADETGFVGIVPGSAGPNGEAVMALQAVALLVNNSLEGLSAGLTDLNADAIPEIVIQGDGPDYCAAEGCETFVVTVTESSASVIARVIAQGSLEVAASATDGWRDLIVWGQAGATILRYDGEAYR